MPALFPLCYAGNIAYYSALLRTDDVCFELHEHFPKQTYRNRMEVLGPNGRQKLVIPTLKTGSRRTTGNVQISYHERWQKDHWKSMEAAYRRSPYFEFYEDRFRPFYQEETELLSDFNIRMHEVILDILGVSLEHTFTTSYNPEMEADFRNATFQEAVPSESYMQVFSDRHPFESNLSILDAIFNLGPSAKDVLQ